MGRSAVVVLVSVLVVAGGVLHGIWSHRWRGWDVPAVRASADRLEAMPLQIGSWEGTRIEQDSLPLPEEVVGRGVTTRFVDRTDGTAVILYFACGPTDAIVAHIPPVCYQANGYNCLPPDLRFPIPTSAGTDAEFMVSNFSKGEGVPVHLRVFWSYSDGRGWQVPANPRRTYRQTPILYKCYAIRQVLSPDEPMEGDPCARLLNLVLPRLDEILSGGRQ